MLTAGAPKTAFFLGFCSGVLLRWQAVRDQLWDTKCCLIFVHGVVVIKNTY